MDRSMSQEAADAALSRPTVEEMHGDETREEHRSVSQDEQDSAWVAEQEDRRKAEELLQISQIEESEGAPCIHRLLTWLLFACIPPPSTDLFTLLSPVFHLPSTHHPQPSTTLHAALSTW